MSLAIRHPTSVRLAAYEKDRPLHRDQDASVLVICQERVLATTCLCVLQVGPVLHKVAVGHDPGEFAGDGAVDGLGNIEVGREEYVKVPLVDLDSTLR